MGVDGQWWWANSRCFIHNLISPQQSPPGSPQLNPTWTSRRFAHGIPARRETWRGLSDGGRKRRLGWHRSASYNCAQPSGKRIGPRNAALLTRRSQRGLHIKAKNEQTSLPSDVDYVEGVCSGSGGKRVLPPIDHPACTFAAPRGRPAGTRRA